MDDADSLARTLRELDRQVADLERENGARDEAVERAKRNIEQLRKRRLRHGVRQWEGAQRAALRFVVLSLGCVALITGGAALDATLGGVTIVASFAVLVLEGLR